MPRHVDDATFVHSALHHHVDLDRCEPRGRRRVDAVEHLRHRKVGIVHCAKRGVVERVEAYRDAREPGIAQAARLLRKEGAVGGECDIGNACFRQHRDQPLDVPPQKWLAAREADLCHAARNE